MSPFRRALAAVSMAATAAAGGLLIAAASTVAASAAVTGTPAAPHGAHKITITAHPRAGTRGIGPRDILPCTVKRGPGITPASCGAQTISCEITALTPLLYDAPGVGMEVQTQVTTSCDHPVDEIDQTATLLTPQRNVPEKFDVRQNQDFAVSVIVTACQTGVLSTIGTAEITFPAGYVLTAGTNPIRDISDSLAVHASDCNPVVSGGGGGGGGGCVVRAPSLARHPAGRHPDLISCG